MPFSLDSVALTKEGRAQLDELDRALQFPELEGKRFALKEHTDATGSAEHKQKLIERRAGAVRAYLTERFGIDPKRSKPKGLAPSASCSPIAPPRNETEGLKSKSWSRASE